MTTGFERYYDREREISSGVSIMQRSNDIGIDIGIGIGIDFFSSSCTGMSLFCCFVSCSHSWRNDSPRQSSATLGRRPGDLPSANVLETSLARPAHSHRSISFRSRRSSDSLPHSVPKQRAHVNSRPDPIGGNLSHE
jgi:hypothetical protein